MINLCACVTFYVENSNKKGLRNKQQRNSVVLPRDASAVRYGYKEYFIV